MITIEQSIETLASEARVNALASAALTIARNISNEFVLLMDVLKNKQCDLCGPSYFLTTRPDESSPYDFDVRIEQLRNLCMAINALAMLESFKKEE